MVISKKLILFIYFKNKNWQHILENLLKRKEKDYCISPQETIPKIKPNKKLSIIVVKLRIPKSIYSL